MVRARTGWHAPQGPAPAEPRHRQYCKASRVCPVLHSATLLFACTCGEKTVKRSVFPVGSIFTALTPSPPPLSPKGARGA